MFLHILDVLLLNLAYRFFEIPLHSPGDASTLKLKVEARTIKNIKALIKNSEEISLTKKTADSMGRDQRPIKNQGAGDLPLFLQVRKIAVASKSKPGTPYPSVKSSHAL